MKQKMNETLTGRAYGIEIECYCKVGARAVANAITAAGVDCNAEGYNHYTRQAWKIVSDGSLNSAPRGHRYAMEVVSPKLYGADGLEQIEKVCAVLNSVRIDAQVNKSTGLHVHHNASDYNRKQLFNIFHLYKTYEDEIDQLVAPSRRGNRAYYCQGFQNVTNFRNLSGRYWKVNLSSYHRHGTVEIRHFNGSTDADKIRGWVVFTQAIVERAASAVKKVKKAGTRQTMFGGLHMYKCSTLVKEARDENEKVRIASVMKNIRKWAKERKDMFAATA